MKHKKGFTLIETMVAISVILVGVVGIYSLVPYYLKQITENSDRFVAAQLAREGVELVRNLRDNNLLAGSDWKLGIDTCVSGCEMDYNDTALSTYNDSNVLRIDDNTGYYTYDSGVATRYQRKITVSSPSPDEYLNVEVEIKGLAGGSSFKAREQIYNWR